MDAIKTRVLAADILEDFEDVLEEYNIDVPSPEDGEKEEDNEACLYGTTYANLLDTVEQRIIDVLSSIECMRNRIKPYTF